MSLEPTPAPATVSPPPPPARRVSPPSSVAEEGWVAGTVPLFTKFNADTYFESEFSLFSYEI